MISPEIMGGMTYVVIAVAAGRVAKLDETGLFELEVTSLDVVLDAEEEERVEVELCAIEELAEDEDNLATDEDVDEIGSGEVELLARELETTVDDALDAEAAVLL